MEERKSRETERNERKEGKTVMERADSEKKKKQRQPKKTDERMGKEGNKNRQLKTKSKGEMNYASV